MERLKKISQEIIHRNPWWVYKRDIFEKENGGEGEYFYGETLGNAMVIPVTEDSRVVLVVQYRYINQKLSTEFPCGGRQGKETFLETAKRELREETGWLAEDFSQIGAFQGLNGLMDDECRVFLTDATEQGESQNGEDEETEVIYRRPDEIEEMIRRNDIWDGQTLAAWALAKHHFFNAN
ncbi:MAG: NUDIX hydrolase [Patescibacteria group bacterium]